METPNNFKTYLQQKHDAGELVVFPTGMGSEVGELGANLEPPYRLSLPLWAVGALLDSTGQGLVRQVHLNAALLGNTDIITSATWMRRTAFRDINEDWEQASEEAFTRGVQLMVAVKKEITRRYIWAGGSYGPLMDSHNYDPTKLLPEDDLLKTHTRTAQILVAASDDLDFLIPETACCDIEAWTMAKAASLTGKPFIIGLTPGENGNLRDGHPLGDTVARISALNGFAGVGINCVDPALVEPALGKLRASYDGPLVVYANGLGEAHGNGVDWVYDHSPEAIGRYAAAIDGWVENYRVTGIGGCCGTTAHTYGRFLGKAVREKNRRRAFAVAAAV